MAQRNTGIIAAESIGTEGKANITPIRHLLSIIFSFVLVRHLPKPAQHVPVVEYSPLEIAGSAERDGAGVPEEFPLPLRRLYRDRRTCAVDGLSGHEMPALRPSPDVQPIWRMTEPIALMPINSVRHLTSKENVGCAWF